jgi:hypothetical protein
MQRLLPTRTLPPPCHMQREHEDRRALFSCFYWACWSWNRRSMQRAALQPPPAAFWRQLLALLQLSAQQADAWLAARRELLRELQAVAAEWREMLPTLALELLRFPQVRAGPGQGAGFPPAVLSLNVL